LPERGNLARSRLIDVAARYSDCRIHGPTENRSEHRSGNVLFAAAALSIRS
jgi:hypothetical protein